MIGVTTLNLMRGKELLLRALLGWYRRQKISLLAFARNRPAEVGRLPIGAHAGNPHVFCGVSLHGS